MATKGLCKPYYALYTPGTDTASYASGGLVGHAISYSLSANKTDDVNLYADNVIVETDKGKFREGTLTLNTDNLSQAVSKALLGAKEKTRSVGTGQDAVTVTELVWDDEATSVNIGFGIIECKQVSNVDKFRAVILLNVAFSLNSEEATTQGETVEWQTPTIEGKVYRSALNDSDYKHPWKVEATFDTEAAAEAYIKAVLNITA